MDCFASLAMTAGVRWIASRSLSSGARSRDGARCRVRRSSCSNSIQPPKRPILIKAEHRIRREPGRMGFVTGTATAQAYEPRYIRLDPNDNVHSRTGDLEHDPEKWVPVFPRDKREAFARRSCSNKKIERDDDSKKSHPALTRISR